MRGAGVEMRGIARLQQMLFALEHELHASRQHIEPFFAVVLVEFFVMPVRWYRNRNCLEAGERATAGNRPIAESVCGPGYRTAGANHGASRRRLIAGVEQRANRDVVDLPQRDQRGERGLASPSLQPGKVRLSSHGARSLMI